jgi:hypothetical protein
MHKIIFIHGFGVTKNARGLFTGIAQAFEEKGAKCILADLNVVDEVGNITLNTISKQAKIIQKVFQENYKEGDVMDLICHSQGCVVGAVVGLPHIRKVVLMTPPTNNDIQKTLEFFKSRPDTVINLEGESYLTRADGSRTIAPKEYWQDRQDINYLEEYKKLAEHNNLTTIIANQDEVVSNEGVGELSEIGEVVKLNSDHNFTGEARQKLIEVLRKVLTI